MTICAGRAPVALVVEALSASAVVDETLLLLGAAKTESSAFGLATLGSAVVLCLAFKRDPPDPTLLPAR
jgi:hypothetical protein